MTDKLKYQSDATIERSLQTQMFTRKIIIMSWIALCMSLIGFTLNIYNLVASRSSGLFVWSLVFAASAILWSLRAFLHMKEGFPKDAIGLVLKEHPLFAVPVILAFCFWLVVQILAFISITIWRSWLWFSSMAILEMFLLIFLTAIVVGFSLLALRFSHPEDS